MYVAYGVFYEGPSDAAYFDTLIPRVIDDLITRYPRGNVDHPNRVDVVFGRNGRSPQKVGREICAARDEIHMVFIHADTGGRAQEADMASRSDAYCRCAHDKCGFSCDLCIRIKVRHETEAWALADPDAVKAALGFSGSLNIPAGAGMAESLPDPKAVLRSAVRKVRGKRFRDRDIARLLPVIAQRQRLDVLLGSNSFKSFHHDTARALTSLRAIDMPLS